MDPGAGVDLRKKLGDAVSQGEILYTVYADFPADFEFARRLIEKDDGYTIGVEGEITAPLR